MQAFADVGIYVLASFYTPKSFLVEFDPVWDTTLYRQYTAGIDMLSKWNNSLGFAMRFDDETDGTDLTAFYISYVKRITKDLKSYIKQKNYRKIPVGYRLAAFWPNEDDALDTRRLNYLSCGVEDGESSDFLALELQDCPHEKDVEHIGRLYAQSGMPVWAERLRCGNNTDTKDPPSYKDLEKVFSPNIAEVLVGGIALEFKYDTAKRKHHPPSSRETTTEPCRYCPRN